MSTVSGAMVKNWLADAVHQLRLGGVIAYPTEAVWGLGCDPWNEAAVKRLLLLKERPIHKGLIITAACAEQFQPLLAHLSAQDYQQVTATWPGAVTWLLPDPDHWVPSWIKGRHHQVAVRVNAHPQVRLLSRAFNGPIVSTSANKNQMPSLRERSQVVQQFAQDVSITPGRVLGDASPSRIRDLQSGTIMR